MGIKSSFAQLYVLHTECTSFSFNAVTVGVNELFVDGNFYKT